MSEQRVVTLDNRIAGLRAGHLFGFNIPAFYCHADAAMNRCGIHIDHTPRSERAALATAPDGVIEAVEVINHRWFLGVQWHPELTAADDDSQQNLFDEIVRQSEVAKPTLDEAPE